MSNQLIEQYFELNALQKSQFAQLGNLYTEWNEKINVISRKDIDQLYTKHILHSLAIAKIYEFMPGHRVLDVGTGGGFPGIPLAILFPQTQFHLIDSIGKKIKVVNAVKEELNLTNVTAEQKRAEKLKSKYHFVVSRAVTQMPRFVAWVQNKIAKKPLSGQKIANGILYLKGGDLTEELDKFPQAVLYPISDFFENDFFETKKVVYLPRER